MRLPFVSLAVAVGAALAATAAEPVVVGQDRAVILRLPQDADNVIIGNTAYFDVTVEDPRMLVLFGKQPGQTNLIVLDAQRNEIMATPVVVRAPGDGTDVRVYSRGGRSGVSETAFSCGGGRCVQSHAGGTPSAAPAAPDAATPAAAAAHAPAPAAEPAPDAPPPVVGSQPPVAPRSAE